MKVELCADCGECRTEKMSGRRGGRPLGRGGNGRVRGPKSARFFIPHGARRRPFRCARKQQHDAQEQTPDNHPNGSKTELPSDHSVILPGASCRVDSSPGSILPVLEGGHFASPSGTNVLPLDSVHMMPPTRIPLCLICLSQRASGMSNLSMSADCSATAPGMGVKPQLMRITRSNVKR